MAVNLSPVGGVAAQFFNNDGVPLAGGLIYTYAAGTSTPATTYTDASGTIPHTNPIVLDSAGRVPGGEIWLADTATYKFVIKDANDTLIGTYDNLVGINSNFVNYTSSQEIQTATAGQTVFTFTTMAYQPGTNSLSVFVDGVNQYGSGAQYAYTETSSTSVTFASGLHVGAQVKFTTTAINASSYGDAFQISYTPPFTGGVATNVGAKLSQTVSVTDFGAVGDGVTDDSAAFQAAVDCGAGTVLIPEGTYVCQFTINFGQTTNLIGVGQPWGVKLILPTGSTGTIVSMEQTNIQWGMWTIENISFGGFPTHDANNNKGVGIMFGQAPYQTSNEYAGVLRVINCNFANLWTAIWKPYGNIGNEFKDCSFMNCNMHYRVDTTLQPVGGVGMQGGADTFFKCHFSEAELASIYYSYGAGSQTSFRDCIWEQNPGFAAYFNGPSDTIGVSFASFNFDSCYMETNGFAANVVLPDGYNAAPVYFYASNMRSILCTACTLQTVKVSNATLVLRNCEFVIANTDGIPDAGSYIDIDGLPDRAYDARAAYVSKFYSRDVHNYEGIVTKPRSVIVNPPEGSYPISRPMVGTVGAYRNIVRDGILFPGCFEFSVPASTTQAFNTGATVDNTKWYVITVDVKQVGSDSAYQVDLQGSSYFYMRFIESKTSQRPNEWVSLASIYPPRGSTTDSLLFYVRNTTGSNTVTYRFSAFQMIGFNSYREAAEYLDQGKYCINKQLPAVLEYDQAPTTGTWIVGDKVINSNPSVGQPKGWTCTVAGTPGTWVSEGNL